MESVVVYTAVFGKNGRDSINLPRYRSPGVRYLFFTDYVDPPDDPGVMCMVPLSPPVAEARRMKILSHRSVDADVSVWVDGSFWAIRDVLSLIDKYRSGPGIVVSRHRDRDCIYEEARVCADNALDNPDRIRAQMDRYRAEGYPEHAGLWETGIIIRWDRRPHIRQFNEMWWREVADGSLRDQLSFPYVVRKTSSAVSLFDHNVMNNAAFMYKGHNWT